MKDYHRPEGKQKGVLLPVFSLPGDYGIGSFGREAYAFVDWLCETGHAYWQILPLNPTGCGDSPYQPLSSFAGNPYFIDPDQLMDQGLLTEADLAEHPFGDDPCRVDYETLYDTRMEMLHLAHRRWEARRSTDIGSASEDAFLQFTAEQAFWLEDYAIFMALRESFGRDRSWDEWPQALRSRNPQALQEAGSRHRDAVRFHRWTQFEFYRQWMALKAYANQRGVRIIGDMPIYVSFDSADCWADPGQFQMGEDRKPTLVAGVPPDAFSEEGQLWGNPLYDWEKMKQDGYRWWISRIRQSLQLYDVIRLDHFRGYEAYYAVSADADNAMKGTWMPGPGMDAFCRLADQMETGTCDNTNLQDHFIAEDLGHLTEGVKQLLEASGFPGTKVLQFAFDGDPDNPYLVENFSSNCVVYTGTHDNDTTAGWFRSLDSEAQAGILQYLGYTGEEAWWFLLEAGAALQRGETLGEPVREEASREAAASRRTDAAALADQTDDAAVPAGTAALSQAEAASASGSSSEKGQQSLPCTSMRCGPGSDGRIPDPAIIAADGLMERALQSSARIAIIPLQDYLHLGSEARVNVPGTVGGNWCWRVDGSALHQ